MGAQAVILRDSPKLSRKRSLSSAEERTGDPLTFTREKGAAAAAYVEDDDARHGQNPNCQSTSIAHNSQARLTLYCHILTVLSSLPVAR